MPFDSGYWDVYAYVTGYNADDLTLVYNIPINDNLVEIADGLTSTGSIVVPTPDTSKLYYVSCETDQQSNNNNGTFEFSRVSLLKAFEKAKALKPSIKDVTFSLDKIKGDSLELDASVLATGKTINFKIASGASFVITPEGCLETASGLTSVTFYTASTASEKTVNVAQSFIENSYSNTPLDIILKNGVSLNYFIPDSTKNITEILNYQLGRGSVIRNITDNYNKLFQYLQGWQTYNITTGYNDRVSSSGSTNNKFAYNGSINIALNSIASNSNNQFDNKITLCETISENTQNQNENFILSNYLFPYDYKYPDSGGSGSWLISLLKKDGTWDLVYRQDTGGFDIPLQVSMSDLNINPDHSQYQRTCDGYLRCRITHYKQEYDHLYHRPIYKIQNRYYVLDYLPQKVKMKYNSTISTVSNLNNIISDDYTRDIRISINGLEGVNRVVVEQLDEGNDLPVRYEVPNFKKGYFTATVDKELYTQFAIYSYNNNGSTKSDYLTIEPLYTVQQLFDIQLESNEIFLTYNNRRALPKNVKYNIYSTNFNNVSILKKGVIESENSTIDISEINSGNYILRIYADGIQQNLKFSK